MAEAPVEGDIVSYQVNGLTAGTTYTIAVSAVDMADAESECSMEAIGTAQARFVVNPSRIDFGPTAPGTSVDRIFTVQNVGGVNLALTAVASAPFAMVSRSWTHPRSLPKCRCARALFAERRGGVHR